MFKDREAEMSPKFVQRVDRGEDFHFITQQADGLWFRVRPSTRREVLYIQTLPKNVRVLIPASGDGLLVRGDSIPMA